MSVICVAVASVGVVVAASELISAAVAPSPDEVSLEPTRIQTTSTSAGVLVSPNVERGLALLPRDRQVLVPEVTLPGEDAGESEVVVESAPEAPNVTIERVCVAGAYSPCGAVMERTTVGQQSWVSGIEVAHRPIYVLGDSLTYGVELNGFGEAAAAAQLTIAELDAVSGRRTAEAITAVKGWGSLSSNAIVLIALGTNDVWVSQEDFQSHARELLGLLADQHVIWVDVADGIPGDEQTVNSIIAEEVARHTNATVADWSVYEDTADLRRMPDNIHYLGREYIRRGEFYIDVLRSEAFTHSDASELLGSEGLDLP